MSELNGGGIKSTGGNICAFHGDSQRLMNFNYGYDSNRNGVMTYHDRTEIKDTCGFTTARNSDDLLR